MGSGLVIESDVEEEEETMPGWKDERSRFLLFHLTSAPDSPQTLALDIRKVLYVRVRAAL